MNTGVSVMKKGLVMCAGALALALLLSHVAGFRELMDVLSGAHPAAASIFWGVVYAKTHAAFFLIAPVLILGAGMVSLLDMASVTLGHR